jgi:hypothetical protein
MTKASQQAMPFQTFVANHRDMLQVLDKFLAERDSSHQAQSPDVVTIWLRGEAGHVIESEAISQARDCFVGPSYALTRADHT